MRAVLPSLVLVLAAAAACGGRPTLWQSNLAPGVEMWEPSDELGFFDLDLQYMRQLHPIVWLAWTPDEAAGEVVFALAINTTGYLAFGPTETGGMIGASLCAVYETGGNMAAHSYFSPNYTNPVLADVQRCNLLDYVRVGGESMAIFSRDIIGCKPQEIDIYADWDNRWIYAWGQSQDFVYHGENRGTSEFNAIAGPPPDYELPDDAVAFDAVMLPHEIPPWRDVYTCRPMAFPTDRRYHVIKTEPVLFDIYPAQYHHFNVFNCPVGHPPDYQDGEQKQCNSPVGLPPLACFQFFTTWLTGQSDSWFMEAGLPIGEGEGAAKEVVVQEHVDNPYDTAGIWDEGWGIRIWYTPTLRDEEAGNLGLFTLLPLAGIPPGIPDFGVDAYCGPGCTEYNLPEDGVTVMSSAPHMHFAGRKNGVNVIRYNDEADQWEELPIVAKLDHWDSDWQGVRRREQNLKLYPKDRLHLYCSFDSTDYTEPIYNGEGYDDEMCVNVILVRPRLEQMTACGSFQDDNGGGQYSLCDGSPFVAPSDHNVSYVRRPEEPNNCPA